MTIEDFGPVLAELAAKHKVPGVSLAVSRGGELALSTHGVANVRTGVSVDADTLFQIGSITKVYTATVVMRLVESGQVDLEEPVVKYVPEFELAVPGADEVTVRHLLTHTSGIQGDYFDDFGTGDDAIEQYVASMAALDFVHPTGAMFSYCNSGFVLLGHLIEKVTGKPYASALWSLLLEPAGLNDTKLRPADMLAYRYAVGHVVAPDADPVVAPIILMPQSTAPAGSLTSATARDVVAFARLHMAGDAVLAPMTEPQAEFPAAGAAPVHMGLAWVLGTWPGDVKILAHTGGTIGQLAFLVAVPSHDLVVCCLTNSTRGALMWEELGRHVFGSVAGLELPAAVTVPSSPASAELSPYAGTYDRYGVSMEIAPADDGTLSAAMSSTGLAATASGASVTFRLHPVGDDRFVIETATGDVGGLAAVLEPGEDDKFAYFHSAGRVARRETP
jgi:CubicO group peptidase (beta-lactamase class C family)